jgi:histone acetyltransferase (RNA polymerase elongator complex component)
MARINEAILMVRKYNGSDGEDYFISFETPDERVIFGFCRLRLTTSGGYVEDYDKKTQSCKIVNGVPLLNGCAFIRELHVYGRVNRVNDTTRNGSDVQHRGFGRKLIAKAEEIAKSVGYTKMAIISGVGVREYYRKFGYDLEGAYMTKDLTKDLNEDSDMYLYQYQFKDLDKNIIDGNLIMAIISMIICLISMIFQ